jgi:hypothetical protein
MKAWKRCVLMLVATVARLVATGVTGIKGGGWEAFATSYGHWPLSMAYSISKK